MSRATFKTGHVILNTYVDNSTWLEIDRSGYPYAALSPEEALQIADFIIANVERSERDFYYENAVQDMTTNRWDEYPDNQIVYWYIHLLNDESPNAEKFAGDYPLSTGELASEHAPFSPEARSRIFEVGYIGWRKDHKPWHDAKEGEVWAITVEGLGEFATKVDRKSQDFPRFVAVKDGMTYGPRAGITSARRIWPEVQS